MKHYHHVSALLFGAVILFVFCSACAADLLPDGSTVSLQGMAVTASFPGRVYAQKTDRSLGIRIDTAQTFAEGALIDVSGTIETDPLTMERYIAPSAGYPEAAGGTHLSKPLGLVNKTFGGGESALHRGIPHDPHPGNAGLLVTVWGSVTEFDPANHWFKISDSLGPEIRVVLPAGVAPDRDWAFVTATGICSAELVDGSMTRVLRARSRSDITGRVSRAETRVKTMTLDEKVGQLFQIRIDGDTLDEAERQLILSKHIGGIIYFQYNGNLNDPVRSAQMSNDLQTLVLGPGGGGIPLLISMDQEGGRVTRITGGAEFPGNMGIGAARSTDLAYLTGSVFGTEIRAVGGNMDLAPVLDVNNNPMNPVIGVRSFGEQASLASQLGIAYMNGLHSAGVIATGKHFPGHGDTAVDSHSGLPVVTYDFATLDNVHGKPFRDAIAAGMQAIMTAHIVVTCLDANRPATLSPAVMDGYLRGNLGFDGVIMTDSMGMAGITSGYGVADSSVMAIQAGVDLLSLSPDLTTAYNAIRSAVIGGQISMARLDQSVARILRLKYRNGLFDNPFVNASQAGNIVGCPAHWSAELSAARAAVTLVKNANNFLPLNLTSDQKILLVTVQASETTTDAATRFASRITQKHSNVQSMALSVNPNSTERNSVKTAASTAYVTIIGTSRAQLTSNAGQATLVNELLAQGRRVIVVGLREPYELASFPSVNAYIAAYNYRNCGFQATADVLFGDWNPTGLLPVTIPNHYAFGHGLSY